MSVLLEVRTRLSELNVSELEVADIQPALCDMMKEIQKCKSEANAAIMAAIEEAATPYRNKLAELEKRYAFLLRMSA
jgi:hypothetical protein